MDLLWVLQNVNHVLSRKENLENKYTGMYPKEGF